ncbi:MAG: RodZ domain-containing protein [Sphingopyxis sp.]
MEEVAPETEQVIKTVGEKLRAAREAAGLSLGDIAAQTRVPQRMLDALERDAVNELPVGPYAMGFARTFAKAVALDANEIAHEVRAMIQPTATPSSFIFDQFEPVATNRVPSRALAWTAAAIAVAMIIAYLLWKSVLMSPAGDDAPEQAQPTAAAPTANTTPPAPPPVAVAADAPVRIAASERVWFSLEDAQGRSQFDLTIDGGEFYTIKPAQRGLFLRTGRPQSLRILLGEARLPQLGANDAVVSGIALDAASLTQRLNAPRAVQPPAAPAIPPLPQR